jgi:dephospho-CoA kinase
VHRLLQEDEDVRRALREHFGAAIVGPDGADRRALARIVFADPAELEWLEQLLHPKVAREHLAWRGQLAATANPPEIAVTEVPLLYETGGESRFDAVVVITAPAHLRAERAAIPPDAREQRLLPDEEKVRRADYSYVNDGSLDELDAFVADVMAKLG